jgi:hypothetical protein
LQVVLHLFIEWGNATAQRLPETLDLFHFWVTELVCC